LEKDVNYMMIRNYESTKLITDWVKHNNSKLIYSSSAASYGINDRYPSNLYGWSKYIAEKYVIENGGLALRYFNVYGPGEEYKGKMASVAYQMYVKNKNQDEPVRLFPNKPRRDFVYIEDVVSANKFAYEHYNELKGNYYDVGSGTPRTFEDVLYCLDINFTYTPEDVIPEGYQFFTCSDVSKYMPFWRPKYNLEEGIKKYKKYLDDSISNR
jgi:ADP-L-glycero-D-manno-heptose 6-epimerase